MKIVLIGPKATGKSKKGRLLARKLNFKFYDLDNVVEDIYYKNSGEKLSFRDIYKKVGKEDFDRLQIESAESLREADWCVISTGGNAFTIPKIRNSLRYNSIVIMLDSIDKILWNRVTRAGMPAYLLDSENPKDDFIKHIDRIRDIIEPYSDLYFLQDGTQNIETETNEILDRLFEEFATRMTSANSFGEIIRVTTFGESHGKALGVILDGVKPNIEITEEDIQKELNRRKPGQSVVATPRKESDKVEILSGIFEGKTTGTSIAMIIRNKDQDSSKYDNLRDVFRPGHADFAFYKKYGHRDHRGGGRSSGRETVARVASGAIAKKILKERGIEVIAYTKSLAGITIKKVDYSEIEKNVVRAPDREAAIDMVNAVEDAKMNLNSVGGIAKLEIKGVPAGLGDPVFYKLDARLAMALVSLGAVKAIEFGDGISAPFSNGAEFNDQISKDGFITNHSGGINGGISNGEQIDINLYVRPTPSIFREQKTIDKNGNETTIAIEGRHDPSIVPRIVPVVESMAALVILDALEIQERLQK